MAHSTGHARGGAVGSRDTRRTFRVTNRRTERAWLAGLIEGEGTIYLKRNKGHATPCIRIQITDPDVLDTVAGVADMGRVTGPYQREPHPTGHPRKPIYHWQVHGAAAITVYKAIRPWLHGRRLAQAVRCFGT
jgi:hypothetical protein